MKFLKTHDGWHFLFSRGVLGLIKVDFRLTLLLRDGSETMEVCIETPFTLAGEGLNFKCVPEDPKTLAEILSLVNLQVNFVTVNDRGDLAIHFDSGALIEVSPNPSFEAWQLSTSTEILITCPPEGRTVLFERASVEAH